jgi:hypothetical protein
MLSPLDIRETAAVVTVAVVTVAVVTVAVVTVTVAMVTVAVVSRVARGLVVHRRRARGRRLVRRAVDLRRVTRGRLLRRLTVVMVVVVMRLARVVVRMEAGHHAKRFTFGQQFAELGIQLKQAKLRHYKSPSS